MRNIAHPSMYVKENGSDTTLCLDVGPNLVVDAVEQPRNTGEEGWFQFGYMVVVVGDGVKMITAKAYQHLPTISRHLLDRNQCEHPHQ